MDYNSEEKKSACKRTGWWEESREFLTVEGWLLICCYACFCPKFKWTFEENFLLTVLRRSEDGVEPFMRSFHERLPIPWRTKLWFKLFSDIFITKVAQQSSLPLPFGRKEFSRLRRGIFLVHNLCIRTNQTLRFYCSTKQLLMLWNLLNLSFLAYTRDGIIHEWITIKYINDKMF